MMEHVESLNRLESIVNKLMGNLDAVAAKKQELAVRLRQLEGENGELRQEIARLREEKEQVRDRVSGLIDTIEQWERKLVGQPAEADGQPS